MIHEGNNMEEYKRSRRRSIFVYKSAGKQCCGEDGMYNFVKVSWKFSDLSFLYEFLKP
jgi:hypothetical protein